MCMFSRVQLFVTQWTVAHSCPWDFLGKNTGVNTFQYISLNTFPPPGDLPGIETTSPMSPTLQADSLLLSHWGCPKEDKFLTKKSSFKTNHLKKLVHQTILDINQSK